MSDEIQRLNWRISTLETAEFELARALNALAASEERYRRLLDEAGFPITISTSSDSTILFANPLACTLFGIEGPAPAGRRMLEFYPDPEKRTDLLVRLRSHGTVRDWEMVMLDGRGHSRVLILSASLITFQGQEAVLATSNDITERRHAEALFQTMVETSPDGFAITDLGGRLTYVSPRTLQLLGYAQQEELLGRSFKAFLPQEEYLRAEGRLRALLMGEPSSPSEWTGIRRDGSTCPQEIIGAVLWNPDGTPRSHFFSIRDISNRKRAERTIRWAEKLESLGLMAAGIAHELNNAFHVTLGHLEMAQGLGAEDAPLTDLLRRVEGGVDRATALAKEMLDYSGRTLREDTPLDLGHVVREGLAFWREFLSSDTSLECVATGDLPMVQADEGQIMKVLSALVLNAIEATVGRGGSVVIRMEVVDLPEAEFALGFWPAPGRVGPFLRLEVRDAGVGITGGQLERICDPFFTTKGQGRGLGLSAALGILRAHSACLQILSQPDRGTTVRAYFPTFQPAPRVPLPEAASRPVPSGVLVAEDDEAIREILVRQLRKWGFDPVWEARNGAEALDLFRMHQDAIGLLLTDATMPQMSGPEAFEAMRKLSPSLRGILISGYSEVFGEGTATAFGFSGFLQKPFRFQELKDKLNLVR